VVFVMPDLHHEMHSGPVRVADAWLRHFVGRLQANTVWRQDTRLVLTFDESTRSDVRSCCAGLGRGRIPTIVFGPRVPQGRDGTPYTHYSLLRSIEAAFGLPFLGHAGDPATATIPALAAGGVTARAVLYVLFFLVGAGLFGVLAVWFHRRHQLRWTSAVAGLAGAPLLLGLLLAVVPAIPGRWGLLPT
jgi:Phosphoesterase family